MRTIIKWGVIFALILSAGCTTTTENQPQPPANKIETGEPVTLVTQTVSTGTVSFVQSGHKLNGLTIDVPAGAQRSGARTYTVTAAEIKSHQFGSNFNPISPLITVRNGGGYLDAPVHMTIPVRIPAGYFAMVFAYDPTTGKLEGMPHERFSDSSLTIVTMHFSHSATSLMTSRAPSLNADWVNSFSSFVVSAIPQELLGGSIESGFTPGVDDWQFTNYGSALAPGGHCSGQSTTMMWYYCNKKSSAADRLYRKFDNDGRFKTDSIWQDDVKAYRLCSVVQTDFELTSFAEELYRWQDLAPERTYNLFKYSLLLTHEPQYVRIVAGADTGHAMVVYAADANGLRVCDPNYPGNTTRRIPYTAGHLGPYSSALKAGDKGINFTTIRYAAKSSLVHYQKIQQRWSEFEHGTIGDGLFPTYLLTVQDEEGNYVELPDYFRSSDGVFNFEVTLADAMSVAVVFDSSGACLSNTTNTLSLPKGIWRCGLVMNKGSDWADFRWVLLQSDRKDVAGELSIDGTALTVDSLDVKMFGTVLMLDMYTPGSPRAGWMNILLNDFHGIGTYSVTGLNAASWRAPDSTFFYCEDPSAYLKVTDYTAHAIYGEFDFVAVQYYPYGDGIRHVKGKFASSR